MTEEPTQEEAIVTAAREYVTALERLDFHTLSQAAGIAVVGTLEEHEQRVWETLRDLRGVATT